MSTPQTNYTPVPPAKKSNAALVVVLVVVVVFLVIGVAAAMFLPKMLKARLEAKNAAPATSTESATSSTPAPVDPSAPAETSASTPTPETGKVDPNGIANTAANSIGGTENATSDSAQPSTPADQTPGSARSALQAMGHSGKSGTSKSSGASGKVGHGTAADYGSSAADSAAAAQQAAEEAAQREAEQRELDKLAHEHTLLTTRMAAVDSTIDGMKQQQAQQGLGMRTDIVAAQQRLHGNMGRFESALQARDLKAAKQYMELCDRDADTLDKFVGH